MVWTPSERRFLRSLNTPEKIQDYVNSLTYNNSDYVCSARWVMITQEGHCFEAGLLAAAALEMHGYRPLMVHLMAEDDDYHVINIYKHSTGFGSISKSHTTLLGGRRPFYQGLHELVMSYFDFYISPKGKLGLYAYSSPINLNRYNTWQWRTSDEDLVKMGLSFCEETHHELISQKMLRGLSPVEKRLQRACYLT